METPAEFIRAQTSLKTASIVPEITLHMAAEVTPLWLLLEDRLKGNSDLPPPYWAFAWPGGQAVARYILDHAEEFRGKRVLDFGAGCGIASIASMKVGAKSALAADIDPFSHEATRMNAALNSVDVGISPLIDANKPYTKADIILAGDVCYQQAMSKMTVNWLRLSLARGARVLIGDPGRAYVPQENMKELARYVVPTSRDLEDRESRTAIVWELLPE